jgi:hypothetical protein
VILWISLSACGCARQAGNPVAVRIGAVSITKTTVDRWAHVIEHERTTGASLTPSSAGARKQALEQLISAHWIIGEAAGLGVFPAERQVQQHVRMQTEGASAQQGALKRYLASTGQTHADLELEARAAIAADLLHRRLLGRPVRVSPEEIAAYYSAHLDLFRLRERRIVDLIERPSSKAAAEQLARRIGTGAVFTRRAIRETVERPVRFEEGFGSDGALLRSIFTAHIGTIAPPVELVSHWVLVLVRRILPGHQKPLNEVRAEARKLLSEERRRRLLAAFLKVYRERWKAETNCRPGFVVARCEQYRGAVPEEEAPWGAR